MSRIRLFVALLVLVPAFAHAADLKITDTSGAQVIVKNASLDYPGALGAATRVSDGIRVLQGDGSATVKWKDMQSLTVRDAEDRSKPSRLEVDVQLRNGRHVVATLQRPADVKLRGKTELGEYAIDLDKVRTIEPLR
jgi:hypothetical protein